MKIKVLQVLDQLSRKSGVSSVVMNYYQYLDKETYQIDFMVNQPVEQQLKKEIERNGSQIFLMPKLCTKNIITYPKALRLFFRDHRDYQIIHGHMANAAAFYMKAAYRAGIAVRILHAHNSCGADQFVKKVRNRLLAEIGIKNANYYAACGKMAAAYLYRTEKEIKIIPNAVEENRYRFQIRIRERMRLQYQLQDRYVLGHIGRFCPQKNQQFLIILMKQLICERRTQRRPHLLLIGDGEEKEKICRLIKEQELKEDITLLGSEAEIENYYQMMDCFLLPSLFEGVPLVGVEAQFNGLPCIFSNQVTREIASEQVQYIRLERKEKWIEAIQECERKERKIQNLKNYKIREAVKGLEKFYQQCCTERG